MTELDARAHILADIGMTFSRAGRELHAYTQIRPTMWVPETANLRTSILATWTDTAAGYLVLDLVAPRVPVTLELEVHAYEPLPDAGTVRLAARPVKSGRSVVVLAVDFTDAHGRPLAIGTASFMTSPDPDLRIAGDRIDPERRPLPEVVPELPFAERARCERREPGVAVLPRADDAINASNTLNGGLIALAIEEAVLSRSPGTSLSTLAMRYLRPVRIGPAVATADVRAGLGRVEVRDAGADDRLAVLATTRTFA